MVASQDRGGTNSTHQPTEGNVTVRPATPVMTMQQKTIHAKADAACRRWASHSANGVMADAPHNAVRMMTGKAAGATGAGITRTTAARPTKTGTRPRRISIPASREAEIGSSRSMEAAATIHDDACTHAKSATNWVSTTPDAVVKGNKDWGLLPKVAIIIRKGNARAHLSFVTGRGREGRGSPSVC
jgi:hypothetical protein